VNLVQNPQRNFPVNYVEHAFNQMLRNLGEFSALDSNYESALWHPSVNIQEDAKHYLVQADLPGLDIDDIEVELEQNLLTIKGVRKLEPQKEQKDWFVQERVQGQFYRRFTLPKLVEKTNIQATYKRGVLELVLPKKDALQSRRIDIKVAE
jgi:HSP20 family protein